MFQEDNLQQHRQHIINNLRSNQLSRAPRDHKKLDTKIVLISLTLRRNPSGTTFNESGKDIVSKLHPSKAPVKIPTTPSGTTKSSAG